MVGITPISMIEDLERFLTQLSRQPDFDAPELQAYDSADVLLLAAASELDEHALARTVTIGDRHGALTLGAAAVLGSTGIRVFQDPLLGELALEQNAHRLHTSTSAYTNEPLGETLLTGARVVLLQLPRSLAELEEIALHIARFADPEVFVLAGGRDKHMTHAMNTVFSRFFTSVVAGRGWRKSRVLTVSGPRAVAELGDSRFPIRGTDPDLTFDLAAYGATFGGATLDHGSRLLLRTLKQTPPSRAPERVLDIGCGNGVLAVWAALAWPEAEVLASDQSAAAVAATQRTAEWAGIADRVMVQRADAADAASDSWADLVLVNPPFHTGSAVHAGVGQRIIASAARTLAPGGELRFVFNSHLSYRPLVERHIGPCRQLARDRTFTVLAVTRP